MKIFKKFLCTFLVVVMCLTAAPLDGFIGIEWPELELPEFNLGNLFSSTASAATLSKNGYLGINVFYTYDSSTGEVVISGDGKMNNYNNSNSPFYNSNIKSVVIENGVKNIGDGVFFYCRSLENVVIPDSVTTIGDYAFKSCKNLTSITIPNSVTSIGDSAFGYCTSLTSITIPDSVTSLGEWALSYCDKLENVKIGNGVTAISGYTFADSQYLTNVTIGKSVTTIGYDAFRRCSRIKNITIPKSVTSIADYAFRYCSGLTSMVIPEGVTSIGEDAFYSCTSLTSVEIPNSMKTIGKDAFSDCVKLSSVYAGKIASWVNIKFANVEANPLYYAKKLYFNGMLAVDVVIPDNVISIGDFAFSYCESLKSITIGNSVTTIGYKTFNYCSNLSNVEGGNNITSIDEYAFLGCKNLLSFTIPDGVTSISSMMFGSCEKLSNVKISNNVTSIGSSAFSNCKSLTNITIPDSVTSIDGFAFSGCEKLASITIPKSVTSVGTYAFDGCKSLTRITVDPANEFYLSDENGVLFNKDKTELIRVPICYNNESYIIPETTTIIKEVAFSDCKNLTNITIPESVVRLDYRAFYACVNLANITLPNDMISIGGEVFNGTAYYNDESNWENDILYIDNYLLETKKTIAGDFLIKEGTKIIADYAFSSRRGLTGVTLPDSLIVIGSYAFYSCTGLATDIIIPDSVTTISDCAFCSSRILSVAIGNGVTTIGTMAFYSCRNLTNITIPDSVISIDGSAFSSCEGLKSVTIGNGETSIGHGAFSSCKNLTSVTIGEGTTSIGGSAFSSCEKLASITIPDSVTSIGDSAFGWCKKLENVTIGNGVTTIGEDAFCYCENLVSIKMGNNIKSIDAYAFNRCEKITSVYAADIASWLNIEFANYTATPLYYGANLYFDGELAEDVVVPDGITRINAYAFYRCESIESVTIPSSVTAIGYYAFYNCNVSNVYAGDVSSWLNMEFENWSSNPVSSKSKLYFNNELAVNITVPESITTIGNYVFRYCTSLKNITFSSPVTSIGEEAFCYCGNLESITIPYGDMTSIGKNAFNDCSKLKSIAIDKNVKSIAEDAFDECYALKNVYYNGNMELWLGIEFASSSSNPTNNGANLYFNNKLVEEVVFPYNTEKLTPYAFVGCTSLKRAVVPDKTSDMSDAFNNCSNYTIVCSKDSVAEVYAKNNNIKCEYGGYLSNGAYWKLNIHRLEISGDQTYIPGFAPGQAPWANLYDEISVVAVKMENLNRIGQYVFYGLDTLSVDIFYTQNSLSIGKYAFFGLSENLLMTYGGTSESWKANTVDYGNDPLKTASVQCLGDNVTIEPEHVTNKAEGLNFENFVEEHVEVAKNALTTEAMNAAGFYYKSHFDIEKIIACEAWDVLGDIGKLVSFKIDGYSFQANYYDVYLSELILALNNAEKTSSLEWKVASNYNKYYKKIMSLLKTSEEWEKSATPQIEEELNDAFKGNEFKLSAGTEEFLTKVFGDLYKNKKGAFTAVFEGLDTVSGVLDNISDALNIANMFIKAYNSYVVSKAFYEVNDEFFDVCLSAAQNMINNGYADYGRKFRASVSKAKNGSISDLDALYNTVYSFTEDAVKFAYDKVLQETVKTAVYPMVAKVLGCAAGEVAIVTFAYNATFEILNVALGLGKKTDIYQNMNMIAPVESALQNVVASYRSSLLNRKTESSAKSFDIAYRILRETNLYLYDLAYKFGSCIRDKDEMNLATRFKNTWSRWKCHYGNYGSEYNIFSAHCPVDIYIYDTNGLLVTAVVNEEVVEYSDDILVSIYNGEKTFTYPADKDYTVKIVAREEGSMDYSAGLITDSDTKFEVKSYNIPLNENQEFTVELPTDEEESADEDYQLNTNDSMVDLDYSSNESCEKHIFSEWSVSDSETEERKCVTCGFIEYKTECDHSKYEEIIAYSVVPTCKNSGHSIYVCSACGATIRDGEDIDVLDCDYYAEEIDAICTENPYTVYTCIYCEDKYYEGITLEELNLSAHDYLENISEATCISGGFEEYICQVCEHMYTKKTDINPEAHKYEPISTKDATCIEIGYTTYTCSLCGGTTNMDEVVPKGHRYTSVVTQPTCTENGYTTYTCHVCGDSYVSDEVSTNGHSYKSVVTQPTCTEKGYTTYTCSACGNSYKTDEVSANGHSYESVVTQPTCAEKGYTTNTCSACGDSYKSDEVSANGHSYESVVTQPTCTENGYTTYTCSNCNDSYVSDETMMFGHSGGVANCKDKAVCTACGKEYGEINVDNHKTVVTDKAVAATCSNTGLTEGSHCEACGIVVKAQTIIGKISHNYNAVTINPTCDKAGSVTNTCTCCGDKEVQTIPATGHSYNNGVCQNCGDDKTVGCSCNCHKGGISKIIFKIILIFQKIFKTNKVCSCGVNHY